MIISNQEVAVHIKNIRNLSPYTSGRYALRLSVYAANNNNRIQAIPVNIIQKQISKSQNRSQFDQQYFVTKAFPLKSGAHVQMQEIYLFKFAQPISDSLEDEKDLVLLVELIQIDQNKNKVISNYRGTMNGVSIHQYLQMDFYETAPCQIFGTIHRCLYKFQFSNQENGVDLKAFCQKNWKNNVEQILEYLQNQSTKSYKAIAQNYSMISKKQVEISCAKRPQKRIFLKMVKKDVAQRPTEFTEGDEETVAQQKIESKKRRRIFSTTRQHRMQKYQNSEHYLHQNAQKIYTIWRQLLTVLLHRQGDNFISEKMFKHHKKLRQKIGESIASFKGSWDVDLYGDEQTLRNQLAHQIRNQNKDYFKEMHGGSDSLFGINNQSFFSSIRPIFFQEKAVHSNYVSQQNPNQILIILVHGLGACRLDMQKIKVQLKRYYDSKIRVYVSSSNEGRTQGDIDSMGMRLAAEIDYQLCKYTTTIPKICLIGHSMGGLIIRSALPRIEKYKKYFHSLITLSSPHLGYLYSTSKLVDAGLWFLNTMKKCTSILQMTMQDNQKIQQTFLYKLSLKPGVDWFKKVVFLGSHQDLYVPYYSARLQKHQQSILDGRKQVKKGVVYCEMVDNILSKVKGSITRLDVNFCIPQQNLDNLIGRAAHISFINNLQMVRTFAISGQNYFF